MWYYKTCNIALPPRPEVRGIPRGFDEEWILAILDETVAIALTMCGGDVDTMLDVFFQSWSQK